MCSSDLEDDTKQALQQAGVEINEGFTGALVGGAAGAFLGKSPGAAMKGAQLGSMAQDKIEKLMPQKEAVDPMKYDTSSGSPFDRGGADAWYGRKSNPHNYVPIEGSDGHKPVKITDPDEIAAYEAGYQHHVDTHGPGGEKEYREDINEAKMAPKVKQSKSDLTDLWIKHGEALALNDYYVNGMGNIGIYKHGLMKKYTNLKHKLEDQCEKEYGPKVCKAMITHSDLMANTWYGQDDLGNQLPKAAKLRKQYGIKDRKSTRLNSSH